ncbi:MAG: hypothetical protein IJ566_08095 [Cardiobacteriaceae bacterium]|nr:hypothetical protein [Cardiobacteriaceae bacterium]
MIFTLPLTGCDWVEEKIAKRKTEGDYIRKQYLKELSCIPKQPIDKGTI